MVIFNRFCLVFFTYPFMLFMISGSVYGLPHPQTDQGRIVFQSYRNGNWEIYVMNADGSGQTNLTNHSADDVDPSWSPDGSRIVFTSWRNGNAEIYVMNADGSGQTNLTNDPANDMAADWSPDGSKIVFQSNRSQYAHIYIMHANGSDVTFVSAAPPVQNPHWSPDGTRIVYDTIGNNNLDIAVMNINGSNRVPLTDNPKDDWVPAWSPDGSKIAYASTAANGARDIIIMNADGSGKTNLNDDLDSDTVPTWSPDGTRIAFGSWRSSNHDIYTMNADGTGMTRLTYDAALDTSPDWSHPAAQSDPPDLQVHPPLIAQNSQAQVTGVEIALLNESQHAILGGASRFQVDLVVAKESTVVGRAYASIPSSAIQAYTTFEITGWCDAADRSSCQPFDLLSLFDTPGFYTVSVEVDATYAVAETNETNNEMFVSFFVGDRAASQTPLPAPVSPAATAVESINSIGGSMDIVTVSGAFAYAGEGGGLTILDVSDPAAPVFRSRLLLPQQIQDIQVTNNLAYIAAGDYGLLIVDVSNPANPILRGRGTLPQHTSSVHVVDDLAYVGYDLGFIIFDVSDPAHPTQRGSYNLAAYNPVVHDLYVAGTVAYVAADSTGVVAVDISDPDHPVERGIYRPTGTQFQAMDVQVIGNLAYVFDNIKGLYILDVSNPAAPVERGTYQQAWIQNIQVVGNFVYMSHIYDRLFIIDVGDPYNPREYTSFEVAGGGRYVWVSGDIAYLAAGSGGLQVIDIQDVARPHIQGHYASSGSIFTVSLVKNRIYTGGDGAFDIKSRLSSTQLQVFDVSNPASPLFQGSFGPLGGLVSVQGQPDAAYASFQQDLFRFDVSNPARIALRSRFDVSRAFGVDPTDLALVGNRVYVTSSGGGLGIVDISETERPVKLGHYPRTESGTFHSVQVVGAFAYVSAGGDGLLIIDITDPTNPTLHGKYDLEDITSARVVGNLAYVGSENSLTILDVSDPANPTLRGSYNQLEMSGYVWDVQVVNTLAYLAAGESGIWIVDVTNPTDPAQWGYYDTPGAALELQVRGNLIYVADGAGGLQILNHTGQSAQAHVYLPFIRR
jgi:Tol biopolymer transport system component